MSKVIVNREKIKEYLDWYSSLSFQQADEEYKRVNTLIQKNCHLKGVSSATFTPEKRALQRMFQLEFWCSYPVEKSPEYQWPLHIQKIVKEYNDFFDFAQMYSLSIQAGDWFDGEYAFLHIGNSEKGIIILFPERYLELEHEPDYSNMTPNEVRAMLGIGKEGTEQAYDAKFLPADAQSAMTPFSARKNLSEQEEQLKRLNEEIEKVKNAQTGELADLNAKIEALQKELSEKKAALMEQLQEKLWEMKQIRDKMELQIFLLDSQIYAIECYGGEVVKFAQIRSGAPASEDMPLVIHQKLRYLDEEMGKLASLYTIQWNEMDLFELFLKHSPIALDTFAPNEKCVVLVRLSRTGKIVAERTETPYSNLLDRYDYFHGNTVGIIIRNGGNLYLGWTDEKRIHIQDDLIVSQIITTQMPSDEAQPQSEFERRINETNRQHEARKILDGIVSRSFVYNILQGVADKTNILGLPHGVQLSEQSKYVVYSVADNWISNDKYGDFTSIVKRCGQNVAAGDMILTVQRIVPERTWGSPYRAWNNVRGRGDANRTHDCAVSDCTLYPVNLVETDKPEKYVKYERRYKPVVKGESEWRVVKQHADTFDYEREHGRIPDEDIRNVEYYEVPGDRHVYVSVKKTETNWRREEEYIREPRANFELWSDEYINLAFMNSVWLEAVICSKNLGGWRVGGTSVDYAYAIQYLKTAIDYVRKREAEEQKCIEAVDPRITADPAWPVILSEWKMKNNVHRITPYQAKRFVKAQSAEK